MVPGLALAAGVFVVALPVLMYVLFGTTFGEGGAAAGDPGCFFPHLPAVRPPRFLPLEKQSAKPRKFASCQGVGALVYRALNPGNPEPRRRADTACPTGLHRD